MPSLPQAFIEAILANRGGRAMPVLPGRTFSPIGATPEEDQEKSRQQALATAPFGQTIQLPGPPRVSGVLPSPSPLLGGPGGVIGGLGRAGLSGIAGALLGQDAPLGRFGPGQPASRPSLPGLPPSPLAPLAAPRPELPVPSPDFAEPITRRPGAPSLGPLPTFPSLPGPSPDIGGTIGAAPAGPGLAGPSTPSPERATPIFNIVEPADVYAPGGYPGGGGLPAPGGGLYAGAPGTDFSDMGEGYGDFGGGMSDAQLNAMLEAAREGRLQ